MKKLRSTFAALVLFLAATASIEGQALSSLLGPALLGKLRAEGQALSTSTEDKPRLAIAPIHASLASLQPRIDAKVPDILVEALYLCPLPPGISAKDGKDKALLAAYNTLRALGSLQGIEYYSASRKRRAVLFEESWRIRDALSRTRLADETLSAIPERETLWAWQKDASLGEAVYRIDYARGDGARSDGARAEGGMLSGIFTNQSDIKFGPVVLAKGGAMEMHLYVFLTDEGFLLYLVAHAKTAVLPGLAGKFKASLENRLEALHSWFVASIVRS